MPETRTVPQLFLKYYKNKCAIFENPAGLDTLEYIAGINTYFMHAFGTLSEKQHMQARTEDCMQSRKSSILQDLIVTWDLPSTPDSK